MATTLRQHRRQCSWLAIALVVGLSAVAVVAGNGASEAGARAGAAPFRVNTLPCGQRSPEEVGQAATAATSGMHVLARDVGISSLIPFGSGLVALDRGGRKVTRYGLDGRVQATFGVPFQIAAPSVAVDAIGSIYVAEYPRSLVKFSAEGRVLWTRSGIVRTQIDGVFGLGQGPEWEVGAVPRGGGRAVLFDSDGSSTSTVGVTGSIFSPAPAGGVVATDGRYVRRYDGGGTLVSTFGDTHDRNDPQPTGGPFHFYLQGGAVLSPTGGYWVADSGRGIEAVSAQGFWSGVAPGQTLGYLAQASPLAIVGNTLFFSAGAPFTGHQTLSSISLSDLSVLAAAPRPPALILGIGAGLVTGRTGQYFPAGVTPTVKALFDPWWASVPVGLRLVTTVRSRSQADVGVWPASVSTPLPRTAEALAGVPIQLPPGIPGAYEVDARLLDQAGTVVGATCLRYTVGAPGNRLDLFSLPAGGDFGGPVPARGIALADELGTGGMRAVVPWAKLLPNLTGAFNWAATDAAFRSAAAEAAKRGVTWWVLVGDGSPTARALVANGTWATRVAQLAEHYRGTVTVWEAWNEPNNNFGSAANYVRDVLAPFARAVRAADAHNRVIGGSTLGVDIAYWRNIISAGGLGSLDVAAIHPYTGHNRSWEEEGTPRAIASLKSVFAAAGRSNLAIWDTESAWWSDGPANIYAQGDDAARALIWTKALGLGPWNYFTVEGGYGDWNLSYSLVQWGSEPDDFVKPSALEMMTVASQLAGRPYQGMGTAGTPHVYSASFGPKPGPTADTVTAIWSDDLATTVSLTSSALTSGTMTVTNEYGASSTVDLGAGLHYALPVGAAPTYLRVPSGVHVTLGPTETFGDNLALSARGAVAFGSSAVSTNRAGAAIDGLSDANSGGDLPGIPAWVSACGDAAPTLTVTLPSAQRLNRIVTTTHSVYSVVPGLRDYSVAVRLAGGTWKTVDHVSAQFAARRHESTFDPVVATAFRVTVSAVNYGGMDNGAKPYFWPTIAPRVSQQPWCGPAVVEELEAYSGTDTANALRGAQLRRLTSLAP